MKKYLTRFEARDKNVKPKMSQKQVSWDQIVRELEQGLKDGQGYEFSVIRDHLNSINSDCKFRNRDVKVYLTRQFGDEIEFTPYVGPQSMMVFSVQKNVLVQTISSVDSIQVCASVIRKALDAYD